ncbi:MAG: hypothetical protein ABIP01_04885 [Candidatus Limnocylindria bacterium]
MREDLIVPSHDVVEPGQIVELRFPEETLRGTLFVLDRKAGEGWERRYMLVSDANNPRPAWFTPDREDLGVGDIGIGGSGPDRVVIPEVADPGNYRLCTGNAGENFCAPIEVLAP